MLSLLLLLDILLFGSFLLALALLGGSFRAACFLLGGKLLAACALRFGTALFAASAFGLGGFGFGLRLSLYAGLFISFGLTACGLGFGAGFSRACARANCC